MKRFARTLAHALLRDAPGLCIEHCTITDATVTVMLRATAGAVPCPVCNQVATRVHSRYHRTLADLPWSGCAVRMHLSVRKFFCATSTCLRRIFTERLPTFAAPSARKTTRLCAVLRALGYALGGAAGARLAGQLQMHVSRTTLIRFVLATSPRAVPAPRVVGIDEWAWRRGCRFGTMLVDLERHHLIDLLPDRSADSVAVWLAAYPGVEIVSRDRGGLYAEGASRGAPQAQQVADRFHLVKNLGAALEHFLLHKRQRLKEVAIALAQEHAAQLHPQATVLTPMPPPLTPGEQRAEDVSLARHALRLATYEHVVALRAKGVDIAIIADQVGISQRTVYRCLHLDGPPQRKHPTRYHTPLTPYLPYLLQRWDEGCHNALRLWREIQAQGYPRGCASVERFIRLYLRRRTAQADPTFVRAPTPPPVRVPTARHVAMLFVRQAGALKLEQQAYLTHLCQADPAIAASYALTQHFMTMLHTRSGEGLEGWIATAGQSDCMELRRFARGLGQDYTAVHAGLTQEWNNGQVEGHIHRLKLVKRSMYGRAGFDLLRQRVLAAV